MKWLSKVVNDGDGLALIIIIPEQLLKALEFKDNELLEWEIHESDSKKFCTIRKVNFIDNSKEK